MACTVTFSIGRSGDRRKATANLTHSLFIADVVVVDGQTGETLNPILHYPDGSLPASVQVDDGPWRVTRSGEIGQISAELGHEDLGSEGRCRLVWAGSLKSKSAFRLSAEGYTPCTIPVEHIEEIAGVKSTVGLRAPSILKLTKLSMPLGTNLITTEH